MERLCVLPVSARLAGSGGAKGMAVLESLLLSCVLDTDLVGI